MTRRNRLRWANARRMYIIHAAIRDAHEARPAARFSKVQAFFFFFVVERAPRIDTTREDTRVNLRIYMARS